MEKTNRNHRQSENHSHDHGCHHGQPGEDPVIFSASIPVQLAAEISEKELESCLIKCFESFIQWTEEKNFFIGHIKSFIEDEKKLKLWISSTGKRVNVKNSELTGALIQNIIINITAIIYGPDEELLNTKILDTLHEFL